MQLQSLSQQEYTKKKGERYDVKKPKDSGLLKGDGKIEAQSQKSIDYSAKKGERYVTKKPRASEIWQVNSF